VARIGVAAAVGIGALAWSGASSASSGPDGGRGCRAPGGYTSVEVSGPGGTSIIGVDINNTGTVVGIYATTEWAAFAWRRGRFTQITPPGQSNVAVAGVNDRGQVAYAAMDPLDPASGTRTYVWRNGRSTLVGEGYPYDINERGDVLFSGGLWRNGVVHPIVAPPGSGYTLAPSQVGDGGHVVGDVVPDPSEGGGHVFPGPGFVWHEGVLTLAFPPDGVGFEGPVDVDRSGRVLFAAVGSPQALWEDGVTTDLGTLGGDDVYGADLSDAGVVVGSARTASYDLHAFRWEDGRMTDLQPQPGVYSEAIEVNRHGVVTGTVTDGAGQRAVVWACGRTIELGIDGTGTAIGINDRNQVVSRAWTPAGDRTYLSTPTRSGAGGGT
jgi:probable HAF family extracellular repeat protein